jgi:hypothetical protein
MNNVLLFAELMLPYFGAMLAKLARLYVSASVTRPPLDLLGVLFM